MHHFGWGLKTGGNIKKEGESADKMSGSADKTPESADKSAVSADKTPESADKVPESAGKSAGDDLPEQQKQILQYVEEKGTITSKQAERLLQVKQRRARMVLGEMMKQGLLERQGSYKGTMYVQAGKLGKQDA